jgi:hypothetical protein
MCLECTYRGTQITGRSREGQDLEGIYLDFKNSGAQKDKGNIPRLLMGGEYAQALLLGGKHGGQRSGFKLTFVNIINKSQNGHSMAPMSARRHRPLDLVFMHISSGLIH